MSLLERLHLINSKHSDIAKLLGVPSITLHNKPLIEPDLDTPNHYNLLLDVDKVNGPISKIGAVARDLAAAAQRLDAQNKDKYFWSSNEEYDPISKRNVAHASVLFQDQEILSVIPSGGPDYLQFSFYRNKFRVIPISDQIGQIKTDSFLEGLTQTFGKDKELEIRQYFTPVLQ